MNFTRLSRPIIASALTISGLAACMTAAEAATVDEYIVETAQGVAPTSVVDSWDVVQPLTGKAFRGALVRLTAAEARQLAGEPGVVSVSRNDEVTISEVDPKPMRSLDGPEVTRLAESWGLDRTDDLTGLDGDYTPPAAGAGTHVYVIDTGINTQHPEFSGRTGAGMDAVNDGNGTNDCHGHGTHVAGTVASSKYGMATEATVHPVRVLGCQGGGTYADVIEGINWVAANHESHSIANMSLGGSFSEAVNSATDALVAQGVPTAVAAGNSGDDACYYSPASAVDATTVGAVTDSDSDTVFSNIGTCLDLYAPGEDITSTNFEDPQSSLTWSGTSMASPHVAGAMAVYWSSKPDSTASQVTKAVMSQASEGLITFPWGQYGSPNLLLNVQFDGQEPPVDDPDDPAPPVDDSQPVPPVLIVDPPAAFDPPVVDPAPEVKRVRVRMGKRHARLSWTAVHQTSFDVQMKRKGGQWRKSRTRTAASARFKGLRRDTRYVFRVRAVSGSQSSPFALTAGRTR